MLAQRTATHHLRPIFKIPFTRWQHSPPPLPTPSVSTPSLSTPSVSTPSLSTPSVSTPSVSTPSLSTPSLPSLPPASPHHHDLASFLSYAARTSLSAKSTVYLGTYYEYLCALTLPRLGFTLARTGGRADAGIDLLGHWTLPSQPHPLRVLVQCKSRKAKASPEQIRELEGAVAGAPDGWRGARTVGVLCAKREATRGVRDAVRRCGIPVVWVMVEDLGPRGGRVRQVLWNEKVGEVGGEGVGVGIAFSRGEEGGIEREAVLMWEGRMWDPSGVGLEMARDPVVGGDLPGESEAEGGLPGESEAEGGLPGESGAEGGLPGDIEADK